jgi:tripartite-type tricarboxylate transporter receptor subunit TctC
MVDQISGRVDFHFANTALALPQIAGGKIRAIAVATPQRLPLLPDVPTLAEAGIKNFNTDQWIGFLAPAGTPPAVLNKLNGALNEALRDPAIRKVLEQNGMTPAEPGSPEAFGKLLAEDLTKWTGVAKKADIRAD